MTFLEVLLIIILLPFGYAVYNLYRKNDTLNAVVVQQDMLQNDILERIQNTLRELREVDLRGAFEADDEVGFTFNSIKEIIEVLNKDVIDAINNIDENKE